MIKQQRKTYTKPVLNAEAFVPNTYVAACQPEYGATEYYLRCERNGYDDDNNRHTSDGCQRSTAYEIKVNSNGYIESIFEAPNANFPEGGYAQNIQINGTPSASAAPLDKNSTYRLTWETTVEKWTLLGGWKTVQMTHEGDFSLSTAIHVNMS